jgi:hypothetical protein
VNHVSLFILNILGNYCQEFLGENIKGKPAMQPLGKSISASL